MPNNNYAENLFISSGAILNGHFQLTSGLHSPIYWEKFRILQYPEYTSQLCQMIATNFSNDEVEVVIGPLPAELFYLTKLLAIWVPEGFLQKKLPMDPARLNVGLKSSLGKECYWLMMFLPPANL